MKNVPSLSPGDRIEIVAPAKAIEEEYVTYAKSFLEEKGFVVTISKHCLGRKNYFSGTIEERLSDFQEALDNPEIKAIVCARGGYGCLQLVDKIDWNTFMNHPKWITGFSDVTVLHQRIRNLGIESIHGTMPLNFKENTDAALETFVSALTGRGYSIDLKNHPSNIQGVCSGKVVGGNLSILYGLLGTNDQINYSGCILFIEDLAEHIYHIDRMFYAFEKAGVLKVISGLIVGGMTDLKDTAEPFGLSCEEVILSHVEDLNIPVCFNFPSGHINDNRAIINNRTAELTVSDLEIRLSF